jgi:parvulin-like peptidyl-prolyl isomerase
MQKILTTLALPLLVAGCSSGSNDSLIQAGAGTPPAETVNGTPVPQILIDTFAKARGADINQPEQRAQVLRVFADYVLLADLAKRDGMTKKPEFAAEIEVARLSVLANATIKELQQQTPISDEALKAEYETTVAKSGKLEYDFGQLLFVNEDDAIKANGEILAGKSFSQVYDAWKDKAKQAKVFTRVRPDQLPEALAKALGELKNGESSKVPIKTQFGFHVIHLDIANPYTPPTFDQVKETLRRQLSVKAGQQRLDKLREQAKIEYPPGNAPAPKPAVAPGAPLPAAAPPATPPAAPPTAEKKG